MWKKYAFGTIIASFLTGGVIWINSTRSVATAEDKAYVVERYLALRAFVAPWPFTTNVAGPSALHNAFGPSAYNPTGIPDNVRAWSFYGYASPTSYPALMLYNPPEVLANVMTNLPFLCTNFVESITTNLDGSLRINYWDWPSLCARAEIGDRTGLWTSCYGTNGLPIYGTVARGPVTTTTLYEIWRAETNLHTTIRLGTHDPSSHGDEYRYYSRMQGNWTTIGPWPNPGGGQLLYTYDIAMQLAFSSDGTVPSDVLIPEGFSGAFSNQAAAVWDVRNVFTNAIAGPQIPWEEANYDVSHLAPAGQYYFNEGCQFGRITYKRTITTYYPSREIDVDGTYESLSSENSPAGWNFMIVKTNFYTFAMAVFPSNVCATAALVSACAVTFTNSSSVISPTVTTGYWARVTNATGEGYNGPTNGTTFLTFNDTYDTSELWWWDINEAALWDAMSGDPSWSLAGTEGDFPFSATPMEGFSGVGTFNVIKVPHYTPGTATTTDGFIINRAGIFTNEQYGFNFTGELATGIHSRVKMGVCPVLTNFLSPEEMVRPVGQYVRWGEPGFYPAGVEGENNKGATINWMPTNTFLQGNVHVVGDPVYVIRWYFK